MNYTLTLASEHHIPSVKKLANQYRNELGYVMYPVLYESIERGTLLVIHNERKTLAGFVNYYIRKDGWHTIREIAVDKRFLGQGVGQYLFQNVPKPIRLKCTIDNERAIAFYEKQGMVLVGKEVGRKRELLVWVLT